HKEAQYLYQISHPRAVTLLPSAKMLSPAYLFSLSLALPAVLATPVPNEFVTRDPAPAPATSPASAFHPATDRDALQAAEVGMPSTDNPFLKPAYNDNPFLKPASNDNPFLKPAYNDNPFLKPASNDNPSVKPAYNENPFLKPASNDKPSVKPAHNENPFLKPASNDKPSPSPARNGNPFLIAARHDNPFLNPAPSNKPSACIDNSFVFPASDDEPSAYNDNPFLNPAHNDNPSSYNDNPFLNPAPNDNPSAYNDNPFLSPAPSDNPSAFNDKASPSSVFFDATSSSSASASNDKASPSSVFFDATSPSSASNDKPEVNAPVANAPMTNVKGDISAMVEALKVIAPKSMECNQSTQPSCRTPEQAAGPILASFVKYNLTLPQEKAAVVANIAYESDEFKYDEWTDHGSSEPNPLGERGTRNMQTAQDNQEYAISLLTPGVSASVIRQWSARETLDWLNADDDRSFGSSAWYLSSKCGYRNRYIIRKTECEDLGFLAYSNYCLSARYDNEIVTGIKLGYFRRAVEQFLLRGI
ncbi:hypothetical protein KEM54_001147, partial [Ascosphaera aggregata]